MLNPVQGSLACRRQVTYEEKETVHRVIVGREYYEPFGVEAQEVVARALSFLVKKRVPRQTEGALWLSTGAILMLPA